MHKVKDIYGIFDDNSMQLKGLFLAAYHFSIWILEQWRVFFSVFFI